MKFKFNWGTGITIVFLIFFISIFIRIYISYRQDLNLISPDYYPKGIEYQKHINKMQNSAKLKDPIEIDIKSDSIIIHFSSFFSKKPISGTVLFFRPSDDKKDMKFSLVLDKQNNQVFNKKKFIPGKYIVKLEWKFDGVEYYRENQIKIMQE